MMNNIISATPRPRPPAQVRRTSGARYKASPPPPYRLAFPPSGAESVASSDPVPESPLSPKAPGVSFLGSEDTSFDDPIPSSAIEAWMNERPREELSSLLLRADDMIRDREKELTMTSELSRSLYNTNIALKNKHGALLARLPSGFSMTPDGTPMSSPSPSPHLYSSSLPRHPSTVNRPARARRISVSPSEIALLSDQNAELLSKLEQLEIESTQADQAGKRRLGKLEKEIMSLREELEAAQARSEELERLARLRERGSDEAAKKKQEWDDRIRALRNKSDEDEDSFEEEVRDFAPGSGPVNPVPIPAIAPRSLLLQPAIPQASSTPEPAVHSNFERFLSPSPSPSPAPSSPAQVEYALVAQLLSKVRELEQANAQIGEHQRDTTAKIREAQMEAETIRRLYACLGDDPDVELEVVDDNDPPKPSTDGSHAWNSTVRFRSLRRTINGDVTRLSIDSAFEDGIGEGLHSTVRSGVPHKSNILHRNRKTVVGLFDTPDSQSGLSSRPVAAILTSPSGDVFDSRSSPFSPDISSHAGSRLPTLGSELGSEYGDDWAGNAGNHHLRSSSLYNAFSPDPLPVPLPTDSNLVSAPLMRDGQNTSHPPSMHDFPERHAAMRTPASPDLDKTPNRSTYSRGHRLAETVRSRTHSWVDKRFQMTAPALRRRHEVAEFGLEEGPRVTELTTCETAIPIDRAVQEETSSALVAVPQAVEELALQTTAGAVVATGKKERIAALMVELWLWLQFAIIIFVFIWAMAKRGPKAVVQEAGRNRVTKST
ncbi:hypothetical protein BV25DRAFT_1817574 [Artomyces pyxidatus]|uniref:Uncharacterized protein n=1 Tax=Artomyces pyxidatus TaxID=48021 RepID=A0ACB8TJS0_9AGAM|nr:hypothetical protein BV25DRAFT_1817574 [Artomyces pyxidatus]